jgi:NADH-quinone oxidoreductase subunit F
MLRRIERGEGRKDDIDLCLEVAQNMSGRTICVLSDALAMPVRSFMTKFRKEFEAHVEARRCPRRPGATPAAPVPAAVT